MDWLLGLPPNPYAAMGLIAGPALLLMSLPLPERAKGWAFLLFMWSLLSLPWSIALHVACALSGMKLRPLAAAGLLAPLGLLVAWGLESGRLKALLRGRAIAATALLLAFPLAFVLLAFFRTTGDGFHLLQGLAVLAAGVLGVALERGPKDLVDRFDRALQWAATRAKLLLVGLIAVFLPLQALALLGLIGPRTLFWAVMSALAGLAAALIRLPPARIAALSARVGRLGLSFRGSSGGGGGFSGRGGGSGGAGSSGRF